MLSEELPSIACCLKKDRGKIEVTEGRGRRLKQILSDHKKMRGYWKLREEAIDRFLYRTTFGEIMDLV
jgi:hypothetical protein